MRSVFIYSGLAGLATALPFTVVEPSNEFDNHFLLTVRDPSESILLPRSDLFIRQSSIDHALVRRAGGGRGGRGSKGGRGGKGRPQISLPAIPERGVTPSSAVGLPPGSSRLAQPAAQPATQTSPRTVTRTRTASQAAARLASPPRSPRRSYAAAAGGPPSQPQSQAQAQQPSSPRTTAREQREAERRQAQDFHTKLPIYRTHAALNAKSSRDHAVRLRALSKSALEAACLHEAAAECQARLRDAASGGIRDLKISQDRAQSSAPAAGGTADPQAHSPFSPAEIEGFKHDMKRPADKASKEALAAHRRVQGEVTKFSANIPEEMRGIPPPRAVERYKKPPAIFPNQQ